MQRTREPGPNTGPRSQVTVCADPAPIAYRVWWEHWGLKLTGKIRPRPEFHDFKSKDEAEAYKRSQRDRFPQSVFCIEPIYPTSGNRKPLTRRGWQSQRRRGGA